MKVEIPIPAGAKAPAGGGDNTVNDATTLQQFRLFSPGTPREIRNPANRADVVGIVHEAGAAEAGELGGEPTSPENEVSTVICLPWDNGDNTWRYSLLSADAGTEALKFVRQVSETAKGFLKGIPWMQLPHHGSRRNLSEELIDYYKPKTSFVSAEGSVKHPSKKLVNAVKASSRPISTTPE
jgi:hypothetical protein